jgi:hypothetical protein
MDAGERHRQVQAQRTGASSLSAARRAILALLGNRFQEISLAGKFDSELALHSRTYSATARLRYTW